jgi:tagatose 6-phosphate kinase
VITTVTLNTAVDVTYVVDRIQHGGSHRLASVRRRAGGKGINVSLRRAGAEAVVVSLGADGMLALTPDGELMAKPPRRMTGNPTGAGDAAVAALSAGLARGASWPERLREAVALSAAAVSAPLAGDFDGPAYRELLARARAVPLASAP